MRAHETGDQQEEQKRRSHRRGTAQEPFHSFRVPGRPSVRPPPSRRPRHALSRLRGVSPPAGTSAMPRIPAPSAHDAGSKSWPGDCSSRLHEDVTDRGPRSSEARVRARTGTTHPTGSQDWLGREGRVVRHARRSARRNRAGRHAASGDRGTGPGCLRRIAVLLRQVPTCIRPLSHPCWTDASDAAHAGDGNADEHKRDPPPRFAPTGSPSTRAPAAIAPGIYGASAAMFLVGGELVPLQADALAAIVAGALVLSLVSGAKRGTEDHLASPVARRPTDRDKRLAG